MHALCGLLLLTGGYPLAWAWRANRRTSLWHALNWAWAAWAAWGMAWLMDSGSAGRALTYLALSMTGCVGVAVLGARRPGVGAWNFVVAGLLAVLMLPLAESLVSGRPLQIVGPRLFFLAATLAVLVLNYLPTRLGVSALFLAGACAGEILGLASPDRLPLERSLAQLLLALVPWVACERLVRRPAPASEFDGLWFDFRDHYGMVWGQRLREQFNRSAAHAGWPVILRWGGLRLTAPLPDTASQTAMLDVLRALLKRFRAAS